MVELHTLTRGEADAVDTAAITKALAAPVVKLARESASVRREYRFMLSASGAEIGVSDSPDDVLVQGVIDLLIMTKDGAVVVDYKHTKASAAALKEKYAKQLDLYARAVEGALGVKVVRKVILSLKTGEEFDL